LRILKDFESLADHAAELEMQNATMQTERDALREVMRKAEKLELAKALYGLSLTVCKEHSQPLVYYVADFFGDGSDLEGCWDCPFEGCDYHIHEPIGMPWTPVGSGEINMELVLLADSKE
jgi:hypothetical protein